MKAYEITIGTGSLWTYSEVVYVENWESEQGALDVLIDTMEERGEIGFFITDEEIKKFGKFEDEYVIGGNHCLNLMHYGALRIEFIGEIDEYAD